MNIKKKFSLHSALFYLTLLVFFLGLSNRIDNQSTGFEAPDIKTIFSSSIESNHPRNQNLPPSKNSTTPKRTEPVRRINSVNEPAQYSLLKSKQNLKENASSLSTTVLVFGKVTDSNNSPIEGATVKEDGRAEAVRTDENGYYRLDVNLHDKRHPAVKLRKIGFKEKIIHFTDLRIETTEYINFDASLEYSTDTVTATGWLEDTNGVAIEGEIIKLSSLEKGLYYSTNSDADGFFTFEGIKSAMTYKLDIKPSMSFKSVSLGNVFITENPLPVLVKLEPIKFTTIDGVIIDSVGSVVPNFEFDISSEMSALYDRELKADKFGRFTLNEFPMGEVTISTQSPTYFKVTGLEVSESSYNNLVVAVDIGTYELSGWVSDESGLPLAGARAVVDSDYNHDNFSSGSIRSVVTDETGHFIFNNMGQGEHYVTIYAKDFASKGISYHVGYEVNQLYVQLARKKHDMISSPSLLTKLNQAD